MKIRFVLQGEPNVTVLLRPRLFAQRTDVSHDSALRELKKYLHLHPYKAASEWDRAKRVEYFRRFRDISSNILDLTQEQRLVSG
jgi:hypothetical protein